MRDAGRDGAQAEVVALWAPGGATVGQVAITGGDEPWIRWTLEDGAGTHRYRCVLVLRDGRTEDVGPLDITDGAGSWGRTLPYPRDQLGASRVVDDDGRTIAWADLS